MSKGDITLTQDNGAYPLDLRAAAIDAVQPVFKFDVFQYCNVQVGRVTYQVRETRDAINAMKAAALAEVAP